MGKARKKQGGTMGKIIQMKKNESNSKSNLVSQNSSSNIPEIQALKRPQTSSLRLNHSSPSDGQCTIDSTPEETTTVRKGPQQEQHLIQSSSSDGPSTPDSTAQETITIKKGRGPTQFPRGWGIGKKFEVTLDRNARVIGRDVNQYKTAVGCLARLGSRLPLNYVEFSSIPQCMRDMAWEEVEYNTTLPPEAKSVVLFDINEVWRKWKHEIKAKYFLPHVDNEEYLAKLPTERIEMDQWLDLVQYWKDRNVQECAEQNAINAGNKQALHRTGRTSFAVVEQELMMEGIDPSRLDVWIVTRSRGKGIQDDNDTLDLYNHFTRELSKKPESERTKEFKDEVFTNTMGDDKHSHMKCTGRRGKKVTTQVFLSLQKDKEELQKLKEGLTQDREEMQQVKEECIHEKERLTQEREEMQQVKEECIHEKEQLLLEKEKMNLLTKKLEAMINQFPAMSSVIPHSPQVPESSTLNRTTIDRPRDTLSSEEEQIDVRRSKKQKNSLQDYIKPMKIGTRIHLFCHRVPKQIVAEGIVVAINEKGGDHATFVKVYVEKAIMPNEELRKPHEGATRIKDIVHKCIDWEIVNVMETFR